MESCTYFVLAFFVPKGSVVLHCTNEEKQAMSDTDEMKRAGITYDETVEFAATGVLSLSFRFRHLMRWIVPALIVVAVVAGFAVVVLMRLS